MNKAGIWGLSLLILGAVTLIGYRIVHHQPQKGKHVLPVTNKIDVFATIPKVQSISQKITLTADIQPINQAAIYSQVSGYLDSISVRRVYRVKKGEVLATINDTTYRAQLQQARATRDYTCLNANRYKKLLGKNLVSHDSYDLAKEQCQQAQAAMDYASKELAYTKITAPFDGYIFNRMVDPGATIPASTAAVASNQSPLFTVVDIHVVKIVISIPESDVRYLRVGLPLQIQADAYPGRLFPGRITRMNPALDVQTRTLAVEIDMNNSDGALKPGMFARAILHLRTVRDALVIPRDAVIRRKGKTFVYKIDQGSILRRVPVVLGIQGGSRVQVTQGVSLSDQIVVPGQQHLADGEPVSPKPYSPVFMPGSSLKS
ncbi:MAG: efflux RND transporter periplasmic adaptor subunit [Leptospirales bacterium]